MDHIALAALLKQSRTPEAIENTISYLTDQLKQFLIPKERVLLCFSSHEYGNISYLMEQAVLRCNAIPVQWKDDFRWISLLRMAFTMHTDCAIGPPLIILGLAKIAKAKHTPLFMRNVVLVGYPCLDWMIEGIESGLDCQTWGCFNMGIDGMVCGFSCPNSRGIHLRQEEYGIEMLDSEGEIVPSGQRGELYIFPKGRPQDGCRLSDTGVLDKRPCTCGSTAHRITEISVGEGIDPDLRALGEEMQRWTSVLDCRLKKGPSGLEIEAIVFPGERLPKLPSAARLMIKAWNPETDEPYWYYPLSKDPSIFSEKT